VLVLRAGLEIGHVRSRREVARLTHLRTARVARLERRGLRQLRTLGRQGLCSTVRREPPDPGAATAAAITSMPPAGGSQGSTPATATPHILAEHPSGGARPKPKPTGAAETGPPSIGPGSGGGSGYDLSYPLLALTLALFAVAVIRELRHHY
jgi:hypothetical protein